MPARSRHRRGGPRSGRPGGSTFQSQCCHHPGGIAGPTPPTGLAGVLALRPSSRHPVGPSGGAYSGARPGWARGLSLGALCTEDTSPCDDTVSGGSEKSGREASPRARKEKARLAVARSSDRGGPGATCKRQGWHRPSAGQSRNALRGASSSERQADTSARPGGPGATRLGGDGGKGLDEWRLRLRAGGSAASAQCWHCLRQGAVGIQRGVGRPWSACSAYGATLTGLQVFRHFKGQPG